MTAFGIFTMVLGILAMLSPGLTGLSIAMLVGLFVVAAGIMRMIWAFRAGSIGKGLLRITTGSAIKMVAEA